MHRLLIGQNTVCLELLLYVACYGAASSTRGIIAGGNMVNTIRFITINTLGNWNDPKKMTPP